MVKMYNKKLWSLLSISGIFVLMISSFVGAFGVAFDNNVEEMFPGQKLEKNIVIQNYNEGEGGGDITVEVVVEEGSQYMTLDGESRYLVPWQTSTKVPITLKVPDGADIGDQFEVNVLFRAVDSTTATDEGEGTSVGFLFSQRRNIKINVVPEPVVEEDIAPAPSAPAPAPESGGIGGIMFVLMLLVVIAVIVIVIVVAKKRKVAGVEE
jgi:hypothetical protein